MVNRKITKGIVFLIFAIFFISFASASFSKGNLSHSIEKTYGPGDDIRGWINISMNKEPADSVFSSSLEGSITLSELLKKSSNSGFAYTCNPYDCSSNYAGSNPASSKSYEMDMNDSVIAGFKITSNKLITDISDFSININSNNPETTSLPLAIDILNDGQMEWQAYKPSGTFGAENYECYDGSSVQQAIISTDTYCGRINLPQSPETKIGASIIGSGSATFTMSIEDSEGNSETCDASLSETGKISCVPSDFPIKQKGNYIVCIRAKSTADASKGYKIDYETKNPCGFSGTFEGTYDYDFNIFAQSEKYLTIGSFILNDDELKSSGSEQTDIKSYIADYLLQRYDNNCSKGCVIPIKFYSGANQKIDLTSASLKYTAGIIAEESSLYDLAETPAEISSSYGKLYLDEAGFEISNSYGNYTFSLDFNDIALFSEKINVGKTPLIKSVIPVETAVSYPTAFTAEVNWSKDIATYVWDFGDGSSQNTTINEVLHTYNAIGDYSLKLAIYDSAGKSSSKIFQIKVSSASEVVPGLLIETEANLAIITSEIAALSPFERDSINISLNLEQMRSTLTKLQNQAATAVTEEDFGAVLTGLVSLNIPQEIARTTFSDELTFYTQPENINIDALAQIGGGNSPLDNEEKYKEAVLFWDEENIDSKLTYSEISSIFADHEESILKEFTIHITNKGSGETTRYFIIKDLENLRFDKDYSEQKAGGYVYFPLSGQDNLISFSTTEEVDFISLPLFVSPAITELTIIETPTPFKAKNNGWVIFLLVMLVILIAGAVWFVIHIWYKRKYETFLFKNRNNLYNLMNYIGSEKKKGMSEKDIFAKLRKSGWSGEQLRYAFKKYAGKSKWEMIIEKIFHRKPKTKANPPQKK